ncbi:MAG: radical SAM family heme chaperone HemW [Lachnospiraceae bacterium]|nr:radical SAM family heme chaperone HemW [Lachnospiraceae bacterium]
MKNEISVYVHLPFCVKKCRYCDFLSGVFDDDLVASYIERLLGEIGFYEKLIFDREIKTVYFGGGTPSAIPPSFINTIIKKLNGISGFGNGCEISIEMNPGTVNEEKVKAYLECGINRFSIGLQSVNDNELAALGRIHSYDDFLYAYDLLRKNGVSNINVDLMTGIPHETVSSAVRSLESVCRLDPEHISVYTLILEEGTVFYGMERKDLDLPDEDTGFMIYEETHRILKDHGFERYEISNFAKKGYECRHNIVYWELGDYIGFGAGAASRLGMHRFSNIHDVKGYISSDGLRLEEDLQLNETECMSEYLIMGLRMIRGISMRSFKKRFGRELKDVYGDIIAKYEKEGLLSISDDRLKFTPRGLDLSNIVLKEFV